MKRCSWVNLDDEMYVDYHDNQWGKPVHVDAVLFEMLVLEGFQAGLSWATVLHKRAAFVDAFDGFDVTLKLSLKNVKMLSMTKAALLSVMRLTLQ